MALREKFAALGAGNPEGLTRAAMDEGVPHLARFRLLRGLWSEHIDAHRDSAATWMANTRRELQRNPSGPFSDAGQVLLRLVDELGVSPEEIGTFARWVAFETIFGGLYRLDEPDLAEDDVSEMFQEQIPSWLLVEVTGRDRVPAGRTLVGLHEDLLGLDPSGRDGRPELPVE
ncbi:hypothetical protein ACWDA3_26230 [Nonomuraea rubra]